MACCLLTHSQIQRRRPSLVLLGFRSRPKLHSQSWECTEPQRSEPGSVLTRQTPRQRVWRRSPATTEQERRGMEPLQALFSLSLVEMETVPHAGAGCGRRTWVCLMSGGFRSGSRGIREEAGVSGRECSIQALLLAVFMWHLRQCGQLAPAFPPDAALFGRL